MLRFNGRPNFAALHFNNAAQIRNQFPELDRFAAVRARMDPHGMFSSSYVDQVLGPVQAFGD